jgi:hypothetical protein
MKLEHIYRPTFRRPKWRQSVSNPTLNLEHTYLMRFLVITFYTLKQTAQENTQTHKHYMSLHICIHIYIYTPYILLQIQSLIFHYWSERRRIKATLSFAFLNLCPSSASYSKGETVKVIYISLPLALISLSCRPNPVKVVILCHKKTHTYLKTKPS